MNNDFVSIRGLTLPRRMILQGAASLLVQLGRLLGGEQHDGGRG